MAMNPDDRCVDHGVFHVRLIATGIEKPFEYIGLYPVTEPHEDRIPLAK